MLASANQSTQLIFCISPWQQFKANVCRKAVCQGVAVFLVFAFIVIWRWIAITDLYGHSNCTESERPGRMCYCKHFNISWSCMKDDKLKKIEKGMYRKGFHGFINIGNRFTFYFVWSTTENICLMLVAVGLLAMRVHVTRSQKQWTSTEAVQYGVFRSRLMYKELKLQWKILVFFFLGSFVHDLFVWKMLGGCCTTNSTTARWRIANAVFGTCFKCSAVACLAQEVSIGRKSALKWFPKTPLIRCLSGFLALCSLHLVINTLVASACFENLNNAEVISDNVWLISKTIFFIMDVGMYGQFFTIFLHIDMEQSTKDNGRQRTTSTGYGLQSSTPINHGDRIFPDSIDKQCPNLGRGCKLVGSGIGFLLVTVIFVLSAMFALTPRDTEFRYVSAIQISLHLLIIIVSCPLLGLKTTELRRSARSCTCNCCPCNCCPCNCGKIVEWFLLENPERLIYTIYFLGALGFNLFSLDTYIEHGKDIIDPQTNKTDNPRIAAGKAETVFGFFSTLFQFLVILWLKLLHEGHNTSRVGRANTFLQRHKTILLKSFLVVSVSLAAADIIREDYDKDEKIFQNHMHLISVFDSLYPLVVDFRLHSAIMALCMVWEDHAERKERSH